MMFELKTGQADALRAFLERCEDAERLGEREYVVDLYDIACPITLDLVFVKGGVAVDGAAKLMYDEAQDGWYMGPRLKDVSEVMSALAEAGAFGA